MIHYNQMPYLMKEIVNVAISNLFFYLNFESIEIFRIRCRERENDDDDDDVT